jgi:hypothetical protein
MEGTKSAGVSMKVVNAFARSTICGSGSCTGDGQMNYIRSVAIADSGHIFTADVGNNRVQEFNANGTYLSK